MDKKDAKERAAEKDYYGNGIILSPAKTSLLHVSNLVGVGLGCSIDMIDQNLNLFDKMEQARRDFYLQNQANKKKGNEPSSPGPTDTWDAMLSKLRSEDDHSDADLEMDYYGHLKKIFSSGNKKGSGSPGFNCLKHTISIGGIKKKGKKKS